MGFVLDKEKLYTIAALLGFLAAVWIVLHVLANNGKIFTGDSKYSKYFSGGNDW